MVMFVIILIGLVAVCLFILGLHLFIDKKVTYKNLNGKHVVITGGSSGIGKAAAVEALRNGANVTIIGRDENKLKSTVEQITPYAANRNVQKVEYAVLDVTSDYRKIEEGFTAVEAKVGPIFMLVNCAGMCICGQFENMKAEDIKYLMDLNYLGSAYPTKYVLPGMKDRNEGVIVFVCSEAALIGIYGYTAYSAGKWAVRGLAESLNMELVGSNVRLMVSYPPDTDTPGLKREDQTKPDETRMISGAGGLHAPEEVGRLLILDAMAGKTYSVYSLTGNLLITLFGGLIDNAVQVFIQIISMGFFRFVYVIILLCFHKIVRDSWNFKRPAILLQRKNKIN